MTNNVQRARANDEYTDDEFERVIEWGAYLLGPEPDMRWKPGARVRFVGSEMGGEVVGLAHTRDGFCIVVEHDELEVRSREFDGTVRRRLVLVYPVGALELVE